MSNIITVSREFGSGGRELAKRLAEKMGYRYYDSEVLEMIRQKIKTDRWYIEKLMEGVLQISVPFHYGSSFSHYTENTWDTVEVLADHQAIMKKLAASGKCVFVGRGAKAVLHEFSPFNVFVYASMDTKLIRCYKHTSPKEDYSEAELQAIIQRIDNVRMLTRQSVFGNGDEDLNRCHLCVNTSGLNIKDMVLYVAEYAAYWLNEEKYKDV